MREDPHARQQRSVQRQLGRAHSTARGVLAQSRAKRRRMVLLQDTVPPSSAPCEGWDGVLSFFFTPFSILAIWKCRAKLIPTPLCTYETTVVMSRRATTRARGLTQKV